eukprot:1154279-Pelagomonas_calceolata.AAC.11
MGVGGREGAVIFADVDGCADQATYLASGTSYLEKCSLVSLCPSFALRAVMNAQYGGTYEGKDISFKCYKGNSDDNCMKRISEGTDHITTFGGDELFLSHELYGLEALVAESYDDRSTASYYGLAVVKKSMCEGESPAFTGFDKKLQVGPRQLQHGNWSGKWERNF